MDHLTKDEIRKLVRNTSKPLNKLAILVMYRHGLRVSELIGLKGRDIQNGQVYCKRLKGSEKTLQPFVSTPNDPELDEAPGLIELAKTIPSNSQVFPITRNGVLKMMQRAGMGTGIHSSRLHPHILKHSCAMELIGEGIHFTQKYLGHKSMASTGAYLTPSNDETNKAAARAFNK